MAEVNFDVQEWLKYTHALCARVSETMPLYDILNEFHKGAFGTDMGQDKVGRDMTCCTILCLEGLGQNCGLYY